MMNIDFILRYMIAAMDFLQIEYYNYCHFFNSNCYLWQHDIL